MNVLSVTGHLGQDCRTNEVNGTSVVNFSMAVKAGFGQYEQTLWLDCALWGKAAEGKLPDYLVKGQQVGASGELSTHEKDGKTYLKLRCNNVDLLGSKDSSPAKPAQPQPSAPPQSQSQGADREPPTSDEFDSDLPF